MIDLFGAADAPDGFNPVSRMDAKSRPAHDRIAQAQIEQQFGNAGDEGNDAKTGFGGAMDGAGGIDDGRKIGRFHFFSITLGHPKQGAMV